MPSAPESSAHWSRAAAAHALFGLRTASEAVRHNTLRALLTSLGIMFGVASVIAMLAIGKGAEQEVLAQMKLLGSNNIIVVPYDEQREGQVAETPVKEVKRFSPGLSYADAQALGRIADAVDAVSAEVVYNTSFTREGIFRSGKLVGVDTTYFRMLNLDLSQGRHFTMLEVEHGLPVAIIGHGVRTRFFSTAPPIGGQIKVGGIWLTVVGVLADRRVVGDAVQRLGVRDANGDIYVPVRTMLRRVRDRAQLTQQDIEMASRGGDEGIVVLGAEEQAPETDEQRLERTNRNQIDRVIVRVNESNLVTPVADLAQRVMSRRHNSVVDFEITVPELLLKQEQRTRKLFNVVLGAIASISLVVGGIGIMNIMLASVLERTREIGVRRAVGATRRDIAIQFLSEAVIISLAGGIAGVLLGTGFSYLIERIAAVDTIVSGVSVAVAFGVSVSVGIAFGIMPARRAAEQDPITSLRYE